MTDAISALGLEEGTHNIGQYSIEIRDQKAYIAGTNTLCGSIANMTECVKHFKEATGNLKQVVNLRDTLFYREMHTTEALDEGLFKECQTVVCLMKDVLNIKLIMSIKRKVYLTF